MSLTSFLVEFRDLYENNAASREISDSLVGASVKQAARRISRYRPRLNQKANLTITAGSFTADLPANFASATIAELYRVKTGNQLQDPAFLNRYLDIWGNSIYYFNIGSERFRADGKVYVRRGDFFVDSDSVQLTSGDTGVYGVWLEADETAGATVRTVKNFNYSGLHEINDGTPAKDTITADLRDILLDEVMSISLTTRARQLRREASVKTSAASAAAKNDAAAGLEEQAKDYGHAIKKIASIGNAA